MLSGLLENVSVVASLRLASSRTHEIPQLEQRGASSLSACGVRTVVMPRGCWCGAEH